MFHSALERQLRSVGASLDSPATGQGWRALISRVSKAYIEADRARNVLERSIGVSSREMCELNSRLATERDRLSVTIASMADGLCVLSKSGQIEIANPAAERLLGAASGRLAGRDFADLVCGDWPPAKERRRPLLQLRAAIRSREPCRHDDARFMTLGCGWLPVSFALTPIDGDQAEDGHVIHFSDIRARKIAADALRESESRFRAIFESAAVGILRLDLDGRIADCNRTFSDMLGRERASVLGQGVFAHMHPEDTESFPRELREAEAAGRRRGPGRAPLRPSRRLDRLGDAGGVVRARLERAPIFAIGVVENVTARKHLEVSLREAQKLEAVGQLASGIAHEINTPVQFVSDSVHFAAGSGDRPAPSSSSAIACCARSPPRSFPELASEISALEEAADVEYLAEQLPKALDRALDGLKRVTTIVLGMKAFAHPDEKEKSPADLNYAIRTTLTIARNEYKYVADVDEQFGDLPLVVCHVGELNQVFLNIIVNAAHAIGDVVAGHARRRGASGSGRGRRTVRRSSPSATPGSGIPEAIRHRIFDPFFTTKEVGHGTGQGLAIARSVVVDKHDGELTFKTEVGRGTTFTIRLPIEPLRAAPGPP